MQPVLVTPEALPLAWPFIARSLAVVRRKTRERWSDGEVYGELFAKRAFCWFDRANDPRMMGILVPENGELHVWITANFGPKHLLWEAVAWVKDQREQHGFSRITFESPRKGWGRYFRTKRYVYEV